MQQRIRKGSAMSGKGVPSAAYHALSKVRLGNLLAMEIARLSANIIDIANRVVGIKFRV
jgi:hypothetical protein